MGALDKLSKRMEDDSRSKKTTPAKSSAPAKTAAKAPAKKSPAAVKQEKPVSKPDPKPVVKEPVKTVDPAPVVTKEVPSETVEAKKMGRPSVRGEKNKDYKMVNLAVPISMYDELKALGGGNVTYFINTLLKEALEERRNK